MQARTEAKKKKRERANKKAAMKAKAKPKARPTASEVTQVVAVDVPTEPAATDCAIEPYDPVQGKEEEPLVLPPPGEIPAYKVHVPQEHMPLIVGIERAIEAATTLKATRELAKEVGCQGISKYRSVRDLERLRLAIREQIGIKIGEAMHEEYLSRAQGRPEEQSLGELAAAELDATTETNKRSVKACEVVPVWLDHLASQTYDPDAYAAMLSRHAAVLEDIGPQGVSASEDSPVWSEEPVARLFQDLFDVLNELAPEGTYYGANERGLGEWGFWEHYLAVPHPEPDEQKSVDLNSDDGTLVIEAEAVVVDADSQERGAGPREDTDDG